MSQPWKGKFGATHGTWLGDSARYQAVHTRLRVARGKASAQTCQCGAQAREWAYDHTDPDERFDTVSGRSVVYSVNLDHYQPMCVPCHRTFDETMPPPRRSSTQCA